MVEALALARILIYVQIAAMMLYAIIYPPKHTHLIYFSLAVHFSASLVAAIFAHLGDVEQWRIFTAYALTPTALLVLFSLYTGHRR